MATTKMINTDEDYKAAMNRIDEVFHAPVGTPEGHELEHLIRMVVVYEEEHYPIPAPDPIDAIEFRKDQEGLT